MLTLVHACMSLYKNCSFQFILLETNTIYVKKKKKRKKSLGLKMKLYKTYVCRRRDMKNQIKNQI